MGSISVPHIIPLKILFGIMMGQVTESFFPLSEDVSLYYRTWGNKAGVPALFIHGGPGGCVADYNNSKFFDGNKYFVVEVDQRGTGKSTPSVQLGFQHMKKYLDISILQMSGDFDRLRSELGIDKWLVFGGSWGSALGIDYAERYPDNCLGLIVRGIFLNTKPEFDVVYSRASFEGNEKRLKEFGVFFELAEQEVAKRGEASLSPNDSERFIRVYEDMILRGDREAIWRFFVFENNLCEDDPANCLDPLTIVDSMMPRATSVAFFEARLFLRGTFEDIVDLVGPIGKLKAVPKTWVVQGTGDEVCPDRFARQLVDRLREEGVAHQAHFVDAGHRASSNGIALALKDCLDDFYSNYLSTH